MAAGTENGRTAKEYMEAGKLVPDEVVVKVREGRAGGGSVGRKEVRTGEGSKGQREERRREGRREGG